MTADYSLIRDLARHRWLFVGLLIASGIWCAVDVMPRGAINRRRIYEHRTDFTVYTEAGAAFFDGRDPYQVSNPRGWRYLYPPLFAILVSPLHALSSTGQVGVWFAISMAMVFGCYYEVRRLMALLIDRQRSAERSGGDERGPPRALPRDVVKLALDGSLYTWIAWAGLLAALLPILNCLQRGQVEVLKLYLLLLGFRLAVSGKRPWDWCLGGIVMAAAGVLKLTPLLPVACLLLYEGALIFRDRADRTAWLRTGSLCGGVAAGVVLFAFAVPAAFIGWNPNIGHLETWFSGVVTKVVDVRTSDFGEDVRTVRNQSLDNAAYRLGNWLMAEFDGGPDDSLVDEPHDATLRLPMDAALAGELIVGGRVVGLALLLVFVLRCASSGEPIARGTVFGLACVATLVVCPVARACYFALFLPAIIFVGSWFVRLGRPRIAGFSAIVPALLVWVHYLCLPGAGRIGLLGMGTAAWFLAVCPLLDKSLSARRAATNADASPPQDATDQTRFLARAA